MNEQNNPILEVKNLRVSYHTYAGEVKAVRGVQFSLEKGQALAIVGESGCGKSVTAKSIMGLIKAPQGEIKENSEILYNGENILKYNKKQWQHYVKRLFEAEVAEVKDGTVEIKSIAREAGSRTKMAVWSNDPNVDPVGACVGMNGARVNAVVQELRGEKIDIINWDENPALLIENALSPAKVISVMADPDAKVASVIVPDYQLSLAIGKEGQNARLAARLTGYKIDIKSETQAIESGELPENYMEQMGMVGEEGYTVGEYDEEEENTEAAVDETDSDEIEFVETDVE